MSQSETASQETQTSNLSKAAKLVDVRQKARQI